MKSDAPSTPPSKPRRPFGLNAIIVLQLLTVLLSAAALGLVGFALFVTYSATVAGAPAGAAAELDLGPGAVVTLLVTLLVNLLCAVGLWRRQRWAWFLTMLQLGVFMVEDLYSYFSDAPSETYAWTMLLNICTVFYLNQREVQAVFSRKAPDVQPAHSAGLSLRQEGPQA